MNKILLILALSFIAFSIQAQVKSTGTVDLLPGMTAKLDLNGVSSTATLTFTGPGDRWYALQIGSFAEGQGMQSGQDVVYFDGTTVIDAVHSGIASAPTPDANHWTVVYNTLDGATRTIVATRNFDTSDTNDYVFDYNNTTIDFAFARAGSATFTMGSHGSNRGYAIDTPISEALSTNDFETRKIALYPNPANTAFSIKSSIDVTAVAIYDNNGKKVSSFSSVPEFISVSSLANGLYFVEIESIDGKIIMEKLIKK